MRPTAAVADELLEATILGSFSRIGCHVRRRTARWVEPPGMVGRTVLITGATSGLGRAGALRLARLGATVRFLARDGARAEAARTAIAQESGNDDVSYGLADLSDLDTVRAFAAAWLAQQPRLDVLIHNAGALSRTYRTAADGTELTVATQLVAPFLLTNLLLPLLTAAPAARVITMSSGGMYTQRHDLDRMEMGPGGYDGVTAYARAKRAQVVLNHEWARRHSGSRMVFHAMHPGWADTPGVRTSLPGFGHLMGPLLRTADEGADTMVWLAASAEGGRCSGRFWHDRRCRWEHKLPFTCSPSAAVDGARLWDWCAARAGA